MSPDLNRRVLDIVRQRCYIEVMAEEATMNTITEAPAQKTKHQLDFEAHWTRIDERDWKAGQTVSDILLGCDMSKITKRQIREIQQYIKRRLQTATMEIEICWNPSRDDGSYLRAERQMKNVELAARALREWSNYNARISSREVK